MMPNQLETKKNAGDLIVKMKDRIKEMLPEKMKPERMIRVLQTAVSRNPKLLQCTELSFFEAITSAAEFGLEPNTPLGLCYIIPYKNQATFQMGYRGLVELAYRSGQVKSIRAETVGANDVFSYTLGLHPTLVHEPVDDPGEDIGDYVVVNIDGADPLWAYWPRAKTMAHARKYSRTFDQDGKPYKDSAWATAEGPQRKKTVLIQVLKYAPKSIENRLLQQATMADTDSIFHDTPPAPAIDTTAAPVDPLSDLTQKLEDAHREQHEEALGEAMDNLGLPKGGETPPPPGPPCDACGDLGADLEGGCPECGMIKEPDSTSSIWAEWCKFAKGHNVMGSPYTDGLKKMKKADRENVPKVRAFADKLMAEQIKKEQNK